MEVDAKMVSHGPRRHISLWYGCTRFNVILQMLLWGNPTLGSAELILAVYFWRLLCQIYTTHMQPTTSASLIVEAEPLQFTCSLVFHF